MASLRVFARRIRALGRRTEANTNAAVIAVGTAVNQVVVLATPVDTGRARANWQVGLGEPVRAILNDEDKDGQATILRNNATAARRKAPVDLVVSNNVEYIGRLNEGSSSQAPAGFVERAVQVGVAAVRRSRIVR